MKSIAVQKGLTPVKDYLIHAGYRVYEIDTRQKNSKDFFREFDAVVLTGMDNDFMGIQTTSTRTPIIEASGMTPEEIKNAIERTGM